MIEPTLSAMNHEMVLAIGELIRVAFVFAFGACIGSLTNVLVYRLPLGLDVVTPTSRCPSCETKLTWRENIPVFGWLLLRGKCRFCRTSISPEYPIVEFLMGLLWVLVYLVLYADGGRFLGINFGAVTPGWAGTDMFSVTWPTFIAIVILFACLFAMTLIDARTYHIPMVLTWVPVVVGIAAHTGHSLWIQYGTSFGALPRMPRGWTWTIATPGNEDWRLVGLALGGALGVVLANVLLKVGVIRRSFADYEAWEKEALAAEAAAAESAASPAAVDAPIDGVAVAAEPSGATPATQPAAEKPERDPTDLWVQYPHARREMLRELIFLAPIIGLALAGSALAVKLGGPWMLDIDRAVMVPTVEVPLWLDALSGALLGYLVGAGVVWAVRILGSLAFGKEAMGLGDVHMMGAVGATLGWTYGVLGFFGAAFVGVGWAIVSRLFSGTFKRAMPFGPFLAVATVLAWFGRPVIERLIAMLMHAQSPIRIP